MSSPRSPRDSGSGSGGWLNKVTDFTSKAVHKVKVMKQWSDEKMDSEHKKDTPEIQRLINELTETKETFKGLIKVSKGIFEINDSLVNRAELFFNNEIQTARDYKSDYNKARLDFQVSERTFNEVKSGTQSVFTRSSLAEAQSEYNESKSRYEAKKKSFVEAVEYVIKRRDQVFADVITDIIKYFNDYRPLWTPSYTPNTAATPGRIFGVSLNQASRNDGNGDIPKVIPVLIDAVKRAGGLEYPGIFRVSAPETEIKSLMRSFEEDDYQISSSNPSLPACLLKEFLRSLSDGLIPSNLYDDCISVGKNETGKSLSDIWKALPEINRKVLNMLINFLLEVANHESSNNMNVFNLAIVFSPGIDFLPSSFIRVLFNTLLGIIHPISDSDPASQLINTQFEVAFVSKLISNFHNISTVIPSTKIDTSSSFKDIHITKKPVHSTSSSGSINQPKHPNRPSSNRFDSNNSIENIDSESKMKPRPPPDRKSPIPTTDSKGRPRPPPPSNLIPIGFKAYQTDDGKIYYYNPITGEKKDDLSVLGRY